MNNSQILKGGIPLNSITKVGAKIQLINYQYFKLHFRQLFIKACSISDTCCIDLIQSNTKYFTP